MGWMLSGSVKPQPLNDVGGCPLSVTTVAPEQAWSRALVFGKCTAFTKSAPCRTCMSSLPGNFLNPNPGFSPPGSPASPDTGVHTSIGASAGCAVEALSPLATASCRNRGLSAHPGAETSSTDRLLCRGHVLTASRLSNTTTELFEFTSHVERLFRYPIQAPYSKVHT